MTKLLKGGATFSCGSAYSGCHFSVDATCKCGPSGQELLLLFLVHAREWFGRDCRSLLPTQNFYQLINFFLEQRIFLNQMKVHERAA